MAISATAQAAIRYTYEWPCVCNRACKVRNNDRKRLAWLSITNLTITSDRNGKSNRAGANRCSVLCIQSSSPDWIVYNLIATCARENVTRRNAVHASRVRTRVRRRTREWDTERLDTSNYRYPWNCLRTRGSRHRYVVFDMHRVAWNHRLLLRQWLSGGQPEGIVIIVIICNSDDNIVYWFFFLNDCVLRWIDDFENARK